jgi:hypothetical protein
LPGQSTKELFAFPLIGTDRPPIEPGDRVYIVAFDRLRGYAPLVRVDELPNGYSLIRSGGAVALSLPTPIKSFPGWKVRWWARSDEIHFDAWRTEGVDASAFAAVPRSKPLAKLAYVIAVGNLKKQRSGDDSPLSHEEYAKQLVAARTEIDGHNALSWTLDSKPVIWHLRCGAKLGFGSFCLLPRGHADNVCKPQWSER